MHNFRNKEIHTTTYDDCTSKNHDNHGNHTMSKLYLQLADNRVHNIGNQKSGKEREQNAAQVIQHIERNAHRYSNQHIAHHPIKRPVSLHKPSSGQSKHLQTTLDQAKWHQEQNTKFFFVLHYCPKDGHNEFPFHRECHAA